MSLTDEPIKDIAELYGVAKHMLPVYVAKVEEFIANVNIMNNDDGAAGAAGAADDIEFRLPPVKNILKGKPRASKKAKNDYSDKDPGPAVSWLYDIVWGSAVFSTASQLIQFLELIRNDETSDVTVAPRHCDSSIWCRCAKKTTIKEMMDAMEWWKQKGKDYDAMAERSNHIPSMLRQSTTFE